MMRVLVTAASKYGATAEIAAAIAEVLDKHGLEATVLPPSRSKGSTATTRSWSAARCMPGTG
jgi:flavodoxin